jgi:PIN domain nuclease of toxin-antitoxin system
VEILLDTHAFLYAIADPAKLSPGLSELLGDSTVGRCLSVVSLWELSIKTQIGKLSATATPDHLEEQALALGARLLPVAPAHVRAYFHLPLHHRDPFDRMLIAQAQAEGLTLATRDRVFAAYGIKTVW